MHAEGVNKLVLVTDEPAKYDGVHIPGNYGGQPVAVRHRDDFDAIQRELRETPGVTVILYDQTCATEKRRRRKRGKMADPARRVVINELVCEGCGDCGVQSNCLSVEPLETEFGRKRTINQSSCNKDYSCLKGFCPSFVTVEGGQLRKPAPKTLAPADLGELQDAEPPLLHPGADPWGIVVAGVGGTGVITIGQLLGVAAHMEGLGIVTQDAAGLAQKGGATWSHVLIAPHQGDIQTTRVRTAAADLVLACDPIVAVHDETLARLHAGRTHVALNAHSTPTAGFVRNADWRNPQAACEQELAKAVGEGAVAALDFDGAAKALMGDTLYVNPMVLGFAWQKGWVPLRRESLMRAMELNAVQVAANQAAFEWGRQAAARPQAFADAVKQAGGQSPQVIQFKPRETVDHLVRRRVAFLTDYQNAAYAEAYRAFVAQVQQAEQALGNAVNGKPRTALAEAVARNLFKLMAYKDEYEVARLHADPAFKARIAAMFEGDYALNFHLAPPLLGKKNAQGEPLKQSFGPWMLTAFGMLARLKGLRGTWLDVFGRTEERRTERALIGEYRQRIEALLAGLTPERHALAVEIANVPESIRGYGHVKARNLAAARSRWDSLQQAWHQAERAAA
jgi:indolepyruvate ferredoxin oxidoreductase